MRGKRFVQWLALLLVTPLCGCGWWCGHFCPQQCPAYYAPSAVCCPAPACCVPATCCPAPANPPPPNATGWQRPPQYSGQ